MRRCREPFQSTQKLVEVKGGIEDNFNEDGSKNKKDFFLKPIPEYSLE